MEQETTNPPVTDQHADDLPEAEEDDESLDDNSRLYLTQLDVQRMIDSVMLRYEENTVKRLSEGIIRNTMETLSKTAAKKRCGKLLALHSKMWRLLSSRL